MKTATGYTNVGTENGTIRISTKLYDYTQDATGFAGADNFDDNNRISLSTFVFDRIASAS